MLGGRQEAAAGELVGWWEGLGQRGIGSRAVLLGVPAGWGRTTVLDQLAAVISRADAPLAPRTLVARISGRSLPDGPGVQALVLRDCLMEAGVRRRAAELLCLDRLGSAPRPGPAAGVGSLFASGLAAAVSFLLAGLAAGAAGSVRGGRPAGENGAVARAARAVAAVSASAPVVVIIDDADCLEPGLAVTLIENLIDRHDSQVLVVAAVEPGSDLASALTSRARYGLTAGRVHRAAADPRMGCKSRADLAGEVCPGLPAAAAERIARRTRTFAEVFAVAGSGRLAEAIRGDDHSRVLAVVDAVIDAAAEREPPSAEAVAVALAGGLVHARQASRALAVLGAERVAGDGDILRSGSLARLADPGSPRLAEKVAVLTAGTRQALAAAVLDEAIAVVADPGAQVAGRVVAVQAAHRVRADLDGCDQLRRAQRQLIGDLEALGDLTAALDVAAAALAQCPPGDRHQDDREELSAAVLRLARTAPAAPEDPLVAEMIAAAAAGGVAAGLAAAVGAGRPVA
jgi:hypothetical protein